MFCPFCNADDTKVIDSRLVADGGQVRRRRECLHCGERFTTFELAELVMPRVIKTDGSRRPLMRKNYARWFHKRNLESASLGKQIEISISQIKHFLG